MDDRIGNYFKTEHDNLVNAAVIQDEIIEDYFNFSCKLFEDANQEKANTGKNM